MSLPPSEPVRRRMQAQRRAGTEPELRLRRELHRRGLRFRVGVPVPRQPRRSIDIAFPRTRLAVFVDGCFWHSCPEHSVPSKSNSDFWTAKLLANVERDRATSAHLQAFGWTVIRVWEHEKTGGAADLIERIVRGGEID